MGKSGHVDCALNPIDTYLPLSSFTCRASGSPSHHLWKNGIANDVVKALHRTATSLRRPTVPNRVEADVVAERVLVGSSGVGPLDDCIFVLFCSILT
jgi:hypothetical protein